MKLSIKRIQLKTVFVYLWIFLLILDCFSIYYKTIGYQVTQITNIIMTIAAFFLIERKTLTLEKKNVKALIYLMISFAFLFVFCDYKYLGFITGSAVPIILFYTFFSTNMSRTKIEQILVYYENIVLIISAVSLVLYLAGTVLSLVSPSNVLSATSVGWADFNYASYHGIYFEGQRTYIFGKTITRNIGIFLEAPVFAYVLITALYIELFMRKNARKIPFIILLATIVTTFSSTAIAISLILMFAFYYWNYMKHSWLKLLVPIFAILVSYAAITVVLDKLAIGNDSGAARLNDFMSCWIAFAANPLIGIGFNNVSGVNPYRILKIGTGMSSGIPYVFANGGIVHGLIYIVPAFIGVINMIARKRYLEPRFIGFVVVQTVLLTVIVTEYTLLAQFLLSISWLFIVNWKKFSKSSLEESIA